MEISIPFFFFFFEPLYQCIPIFCKLSIKHVDVDTTQQVTDWRLVIRSHLDPRPALRDLGDSPCDEVGAEAGDSVGGVTHEDHHVCPLLHLPSPCHHHHYH